MNNKPKVRVKGRFVVVVFLLSVVVVGGIIFTTQAVTRSKNEEVDRLDAVLIALEKEPDVRIIGDEHKEVLETLRSSSVAYVRDKATILLADSAFHEEDFENALTLYKTVAQRKRSYLAPKAQLNSAYVYLALGNEAQAVEAFSQVVTYHRTMLNPELLYEADVMRASLMESSDKGQAVQIYQDIVRSLDQENIWRMVAQVRLIVLNEEINF